MNRFTTTFIVLAALAGCMTARDPVEDAYYGPPRRQYTPPSQPRWSGADGKSVQSAYNWGSSTRPSYGAGSVGSYSYPQHSSAAAKKATSSSTLASAKTPARSGAAKMDSKVVRTAHSDAKTSYNYGDDDSGLPSATAYPRGTTRSSAAESKTPPINLGVLRLLNKKRITFHYEVKDPASAGVSGLELWGTTDMRTWKKYDMVARTASALAVEVKDEGLYGFTMIARGKGELTKNQPPRTGEPPQVWVAVDLTKPIVQVFDAGLDLTSRSPALVIRWSAKDQHFGPRPITLLYAERSQGPWLPIAANVENSGRYEWTMPAGVPAKLYLRVQAADMMGNINTADSTLLHIPGRSASTSGLSTTTAIEPARLSNVPTTSVESNLRPVTASLANPAVSILNVDSGD